MVIDDCGVEVNTESRERERAVKTKNVTRVPVSAFLHIFTGTETQIVENPREEIIFSESSLKQAMMMDLWWSLWVTSRSDKHTPQSDYQGTV